MSQEKVQIIPNSSNSILITVLYIEGSKEYPDEYLVENHHIIGWKIIHSLSIEEDTIPTHNITPISPTFDPDCNNEKIVCYLRPDGKLDDPFDRTYFSIDEMISELKNRIENKS